MKTQKLLRTIAFYGAILLIAFAYSFTLQKDDSSKDNDKNIIGDDYPSVIIGSQEWMTENLNVDKFRNGDQIPEAKSNSEWEKAGDDKKPAWCYYDNDTAKGKIYGKLYNWYAVNDPRGLAPEGWHVPSDEEWTILTEYLGGKKKGTKMKSTGTQYWSSPNGGATNSSGFSGLPGGNRYDNGSFNLIGGFGIWWSSSLSIYDVEIHNGLPFFPYAWTRDLNYLNGNVYRTQYPKYVGLSVRCFRD